MAMMAMASIKTKAMIMAVNILGEAEGFLPKALMLAALPKAKTNEGPRMHKPKIRTRAMFLSISNKSTE